MDSKKKIVCKINENTKRCSVKGTISPELCVHNPDTNRCKYSKKYKEDKKDHTQTICPDGQIRNDLTGKCDIIEGQNIVHKERKKREKKATIRENNNDNSDFFKEKCQDDIDKINFENPEHIKCLRIKENLERETLEKNVDNNMLYPNLNDPNFNSKITLKKEFFDTRYEENENEDIKEIADKLCNFKEFELSPHQRFIRNFLSFQTPYNGLLLYHGLGTGKTCSAILVCEEMRQFLKQLGITKRIIIVAAPNVQANFRLQLFDENKLEQVEGIWTMKSCTGNIFIKEVNPMNMPGIEKKKIVNQVKRIINSSYLFLGYTEFSNYIRRKLKHIKSKKNQDKALKKIFSDRLIVIDEVHNIRSIDEGKKKKGIVEGLKKIVYQANNIKLLLLSATPMFNSYKEIVWLLNLLNLNDKRYPITENEIFDANGNFKQNEDFEEVGKELLIRKATGYVSFVSGDNPYSFPYRILPSMFLEESFLLGEYPKRQVDNKPLKTAIQKLDLVLTNIAPYQEKAYYRVIEKLKEDFPSFNNIEKGLGYRLLDPPLQILNIAYPSNLEEVEMQTLYGRRGLNRVMTMVKTNRGKQYKYKTKKYGRIFSPGEIGKYSSKINFICSRIRNSKGIIMIYSQYIDGGCVPIALALEEMGFRRYGDVASLFKKVPEPEPALDFDFDPTYTMITGDHTLSSLENIKESIKVITDEKNKNGELIKVVIVSRAGSEGIDFKNIRQVHIIDPWYNLNRTEQTVGRAIRNCSHKNLKYKERNCEIYMYGTRLGDNDEEAIDLYIYRLAEKKALLIGQITRVLKKNAVDCVLNKPLNELTEQVMNKVVIQKLSSGKKIKYKVGSKPFTALCDYMKECIYQCNNVSSNIMTKEKNTDTYGEDFIIMNLDMIIQIIRNLFEEHYFYKKSDLIAAINYKKTYPEVQINMALEQLISDKNLYIKDVLGRIGYLINIGEFYMFQPAELDSPDGKYIDRYDRVHPVDYKRHHLNLITEKITSKSKIQKKIEIQTNIFNKMEEKTRFLEGYKDMRKGVKVKPNWYQLCYTSINSHWQDSLIFRFRDNVRKSMLKYGIYHFADSLSYDDKISLLNIIYNSKKKSDTNDPLYILKEYFNKFIIEAPMDGGTMEGLLVNNGNLVIPHIFEKKSWRSCKPTEFEYFIPVLKKRRIDVKKKLNSIIGFISYEVNKDCSKMNCFKILDLEEKRDRGAFCDNKTKKFMITLLNKILNDNDVKVLVDKDDNKKEYDDKDYQVIKYKKERRSTFIKISRPQLCCELELIMRYFSDNNIDEKIWFVPLVDVLLCKIIK